MGRVVAELGRPETPAETAARKAESSRVYRGSQTMRNLIAAIIATLAVVAIIVLIVPRGDVPPREPVNVAANAERVERDVKTPIVLPDVDASWRANSANLRGGVWQIVYAPGEGLGFVRVSQALGQNEVWGANELGGGQRGDVLTLGGIEWQEYTFRDPSKTGNVSYALGTQAGADYVLVYGSSSEDLQKQLATSLAPQIKELEEFTP